MQPGDIAVFSFVTIKIFARTELVNGNGQISDRFVTIKIFARTEQILLPYAAKRCFVTIKIFARTEPGF